MTEREQKIDSAVWKAFIQLYPWKALEEMRGSVKEGCYVFPQEVDLIREFFHGS